MKPPHFGILLSYGAAAIALLLFSYTQVDLNLTLSQASLWQSIQKAFQHVGYYQRPLATLLFVGIIILLFTLYSFLLIAIRKNQVDLAFIWKLIGIVTVILAFSYPAAFSYDFFNYMFTAKTVLVYRQNPYVVTPLLFSGIDPWTNFMRWTHLPSAYTPFWIILSLIPYALGLGYFILVMFAMKFLIAAFYLVSCVALARAAAELFPRRAAFSLALFAFNPLILIETLVSGHNDIVLVAFALLSVASYLRKDQLRAWFMLALSVAAKFVTLVLVPVYAMKKGREWMLVSLLAGLGLVLLRREFLPWYWVWIMPFVALHADKAAWVRSAIVVSLGLAISYAPFFYFGEYSAIEQAWKTAAIWVGVGMGGALLIFPVRKKSSI